MLIDMLNLGSTLVNAFNAYVNPTNKNASPDLHTCVCMHKMQVGTYR